MSMQINLNQLRTFYVAAKHKSMAVAAKSLYVSPPAVSMQIRKLEQWLGFEVFQRSRIHLTLTSEGQQLFELAEKVFQQVEGLEQHVEELLKRQQGELLLGTHHIPAKYFIPAILAHVRDAHPGLNIRMLLGTQEESLERLLAHKVHLALIIGDPPCSDVKSVRLFEEELVLVTSSHGPFGDKKKIRAQELSGIPLILQQKGTGIEVVVREYLRGYGVTPHVIMENISSDIIKQFLLQEPSASFIVRFAVQKELETGVLQEIQIAEGSPLIHFNLAFLDQTPRPFALDCFLDSVGTYDAQGI